MGPSKLRNTADHQLRPLLVWFRVVSAIVIDRAGGYILLMQQVALDAGEPYFLAFCPYYTHIILLRPNMDPWIHVPYP